MSNKLKAAGLGIVAMLAVGALGVMNATATTGGHFVSETATTSIVGTESGTHQLHFRNMNSTDPGERIGCINDSYTGTANAATVTELVITPSWSTCKTTGSNTHFEVHENGCTLKFTVAPNGHQVHNTVHLNCPTGVNGPTITHPACTITVTKGTYSGVTYTRQVNPNNGKHEITLDSTVTNIPTHYHGFCQILGTQQKGAMEGSVTVAGFNAGQRSITAT